MNAAMAEKPREVAAAMLKGAAVLALASPVLFVSTVLLLQHLQSGYDPVTQLMSELALGPHGQWMLAAFLALAVGLTGIGLALSELRVQRSMCLLAFGASVAFVGAGVFPLGARIDIHIPLVGLAFILSGPLMIYGPLRAPGVHAHRWVSWSFALGMAASVLLGSVLVPMGIAQRMAAGCLLFWLISCGAWLWRLASASPSPFRSIA